MMIHYSTLPMSKYILYIDRLKYPTYKVIIHKIEHKLMMINYIKKLTII